MSRHQSFSASTAFWQLGCGSAHMTPTVGSGTGNTQGKHPRFHLKRLGGLSWVGHGYWERENKDPYPLGEHGWSRKHLGCHTHSTRDVALCWLDQEPQSQDELFLGELAVLHYWCINCWKQNVILMSPTQNVYCWSVILNPGNFNLQNRNSYRDLPSIPNTKKLMWIWIVTWLVWIRSVVWPQEVWVLLIQTWPVARLQLMQ